MNSAVLTNNVLIFVYQKQLFMFYVNH